MFFVSRANHPQATLRRSPELDCRSVQVLCHKDDLTEAFVTRDQREESRQTPIQFAPYLHYQQPTPCFVQLRAGQHGMCHWARDPGIAKDTRAAPSAATLTPAVGQRQQTHPQSTQRSCANKAQPSKRRAQRVLESSGQTCSRVSRSELNTTTTCRQEGAEVKTDGLVRL